MAAEPLVDLDESLLGAPDRRKLDCGIGAEQRAGFAELTMRVHVDGLDPFSPDRDRQGLACRLLRVGAFQQTAAAENNAGSRGGATSLQKITARRHSHSSLSLFAAWSVIARSIGACPPHQAAGPMTGA
jgi:hypothetical protein